ncbi:MAG TPA: UDP-N-acetylglucosamine 1-carboxyvinyltransferase [Ruminococcaceae bacterium]|nr:UDP-N-acetylglucosamine 1-carboxyvinyltransferase [Oscillospiraceae bacterium]
MEKFFIEGPSRLEGEVVISGAKNAAVAIIPAVLLAEEPCVLENIPNINDVNISLQILQELGAKIKMRNKTTVEIDATHIIAPSVPFDIARNMRASYYFLGSLLGRYSKGSVTMPGGCNFGGVRPIDQHIKGFEALGAKVSLTNGQIKAKAEKLRGNHIYFDVVTVGATINIMLAAAMAEGNTVIENPAKEPHVVDLANMLNSMGANIRGAGTDVIRIKGVPRLHKTEYTVIPDQIEAGTFMFAAAVTGGEITVANVIPKHLESITSKLVEIGCDVIEYDEAVTVRALGTLKATQVKTLPYPGFPTDMQPQITTALALAKGSSTVTESIFENRFKYVAELARMGAKIKVEGNTAIISGVKKLTGARVSAPDLRAGAALVLAGMRAEGTTIIDDIKYIQRGYEAFDEKLRGLGADIVKEDYDEEMRTEKIG